MVDVEVRDALLLVHFSRCEKVLGLVRDLRVPLEDVVSVDRLLTWREVHGLRVGSALSGLWMLGTGYDHGSRQLVALGRGLPALRVRLRGQRVDELVVSTPDPQLLSACPPAGSAAGIDR